jgi:prepilin-type N-terminal cleavage/methylation domain-containing protein
MRKQKGFSLIELLIVVAIILIIAAIAIPNLLRSRMAANEASAVGSVRTINTAEVNYSTTYPQNGYTALLQLSGPVPPAVCNPSQASACIVDPVIGNGNIKSGFRFTAAALGGGGGNPNTTFWVGGTAATCGTTGTRSFYSDDSFVIRFDASGNCPAPANPASAGWSALQ